MTSLNKKVAQLLSKPKAPPAKGNPTPVKTKTGSQTKGATIVRPENLPRMLAQRPPGGLGLTTGLRSTASSSLSATAPPLTMTSAPAATSAVVEKTRQKSVTISMREEISAVKMFATQFANSAMVINPANEELFPWLSTIAVNFTTYKFLKLSFEYVPSSSTGNGGTVAIAVNPNADDPPYENIDEVLNREGAVTAAPWVPFKANAKFPSQAGTAPKFVTDVTSAAGLGTLFDDLHTIADGVVNVVTAGLNILGANEVDVTVDGIPLTVALTEEESGKLYVDYTVVLYDPKLGGNVTHTESVNEFKSAGQPFGDNDSWKRNDLNLTMNANPSGNWSKTNAIYFGEAGTYAVLLWGSSTQTGIIGEMDFRWGVVNPADGSATLSNLRDSPNFVDGRTYHDFNSGGTPHGFSSWVVVDVDSPTEFGIYFNSTKSTGVDPVFAASSLRVYRVNGETGTLEAIGKSLSTPQPLNCPRSAAFVEMHKIMRRKKAAEAMRSMRTVLTSEMLSLKANPPRPPLRISAPDIRYREVKIKAGEEKLAEAENFDRKEGVARGLGLKLKKADKVVDDFYVVPPTTAAAATQTVKRHEKGCKCNLCERGVTASRAGDNPTR